jgi:antitoxin (DNA-binding transcriptional repressor) of toxin-antitoxin stability system
MAEPVVTVASGGRPVVDVTASAPKFGKAVTEAAAGKGSPVTKVTTYGQPVTYLVVATNGDKHPK